MTLERGTLLHKRYRIVEILGQGGMGSVYRAVDENLGVDVAVKENLFTTDEYSRQFRLEAVILAALRHPNLPRVSDHFAVGEQGQYLVMDFIEGEDLRQRMERQGTITEEEAVVIGAAMCDALAYLHTRRPSILHRDIKPGNVKITPEGSIFLVDFGLAKLVQGPQATTTGARAMTPGYSPPEQYGTARTDPRTDIYSLGATLYAALTGMIPEDGLARAMDNAQLTPLRKRNPKISRRVAAAIEKAMAVDPADRFQTADEFKKALLAAVSRTDRPAADLTVTPAPDIPHPAEPIAASNGEPGSNGALPALPARPIEEAGLSVFSRKKRSPSPIWLTPLFILIIACAGLLILLPNDVPSNLRSKLPTLLLPGFAAPPTSTTAPLLTSTSLAVATLTAPVSGRIETATAAPTSTPTPMPSVGATNAAPIPGTSLPGMVGGGAGYVAFASDRSGVPQIYLTDLTGTKVTPITNMPNGACEPSWAPNGKQIVFVSPCRVSPVGRPLDISEGPLKDTALYTVNADGSNLIALPTVPGGDSEPAWSPDGGRIAFTSLRDGRPLIYILNLATQSVIRLTDPSVDFTEARQPSWSPFGNQIVFAKKRGDSYQIWTVTDAGQGQQPISRGGQQYWDYSPVWSPDGKTIMFTERDAQGPVLPWTMTIPYESRDTSAAVRLKLGIVPFESAHFSPDGSWIVFEGISAEANRDLFYSMLNGDQRTRLTTDPGIDFDPVWQPKVAP